MVWFKAGTGRLTEPYYRLKHGHDSAPSPRYREKNASGTVSDITSSDWDTAPTNGTLVEEWTGNQTASAPSWASDMWSGSTSSINGHSITARRYVIATSSTTTDDVEAIISDVSDFNQIIWHGEHSGSGTVQYALRMDGISSGNKYAATFQEDNNNMVDQDGQNGINVSPTAPAVAEHTFMIGYACHTGDEKLCIADMVFSTGTGAGSKPSKASVVGKTTDTSTIDNISVSNLTSGSDFSNSSNLTVLGDNGTETTLVQDGAIYYDTELNKEYVLYNNTWTEL